MAVIGGEIAASELAAEAPTILENVVQGMNEVSQLLENTGISNYLKNNHDNAPEIVTAATVGTSNPKLAGPDIDRIRQRINALENQAKVSLPGDDIVTPGRGLLIGMGPAAPSIEGENFVDTLLESVAKETFVEYTKNNMLSLMKSLLGALHKINKLKDIQTITAENLDKVSHKITDEIAGLKKSNANNAAEFYRLVLSSFGVDQLDINHMSSTEQAHLVNSFVAARTVEATVPSLREYVGVLQIMQQLSYVGSVFETIAGIPDAYTGMEASAKAVLQGVLTQLSSVINTLVAKLTTSLQMDQSTMSILRKVLSNGHLSEEFKPAEADRLSIADVLIRLGDVGGVARAMLALAKQFSLNKETLLEMIKNMRNGVDVVISNLPTDVMTDVVTNKPALTILKNITTAMQKREGLLEKLQNEISRGKGVVVTGGYSMLREKKDVVDILSTVYRELVKQRNKLVSKFWGYIQVNTMLLRESGLSDSSLDDIMAVLDADSAPAQLLSGSDGARALFNYEGTDDLGTPMDTMRLFSTQFEKIVLAESEKSKKAHKLFLEMKKTLDEIYDMTEKGRDRLAKLRTQITQGKGDGGYSTFEYGKGPGADDFKIEAPNTVQTYSKTGAVAALNAAQHLSRDRIEIKIEGEDENTYEEQVFRGIRRELLKTKIEELNALDDVVPDAAPQTHKDLWGQIREEIKNAINSGHSVYAALDILPKTLKDNPPVAKLLSHEDFSKLVHTVLQIPDTEGLRMYTLETAIYECVGSFVGEEWPMPKDVVDDMPNLKDPLTFAQAQNLYNSIQSVASAMYQMTMFIKLLTAISNTMYGENLFNKITQFNAAGLVEYASSCITSTCLTYLTGITDVYVGPNGISGNNDGGDHIVITDNNRWIVGGKTAPGNALAAGSPQVLAQQKICQGIRLTLAQNMQAMYCMFMGPLIQSLGASLPQLSAIGALAMGRGRDNDEDSSNFKRRDARSGMFQVYERTFMVMMAWGRLVARANTRVAEKKIRGLPITVAEPLSRLCVTMFGVFTIHVANDGTIAAPTRDQMADTVYNINSWWDKQKNPSLENLIIQFNEVARKQIRLLSRDEHTALEGEVVRLTKGFSKSRQTTSGAVLVNVDVKNEAGEAMPEMTVAFNNATHTENLLATFVGQLIASSPEKTIKDLEEVLEYSEIEYEKKATPQEKLDYLMEVINADEERTSGISNEERAVQINTAIFTLSDMAGRMLFGDLQPQLWEAYMSADFTPYLNIIGANQFGVGNVIDELVAGTIPTYQKHELGEFIALLAPDITFPKFAYQQHPGRIDLENGHGIRRRPTYLVNDSFLKMFPSTNNPPATDTKICIKANTPAFRVLYPGIRIAAYLSAKLLATIRMQPLAPIEEDADVDIDVQEFCTVDPTGIVGLVEETSRALRTLIQAPGTKTTPELSSTLLDPEKMVQKVKSATKSRTTEALKTSLELLINRHLTMGMVSHEFTAAEDGEAFRLNAGNAALAYTTLAYQGNALLSMIIDDDTIPGMAEVFKPYPQVRDNPNLMARALHDPLYKFVTSIIRRMYPNTTPDERPIDLRFFGRGDLPGGSYYTLNRALMNVARYTVDSDTMTILRPLVRLLSEFVSTANISTSESLECYLALKPSSTTAGNDLPQSVCAQTTIEVLKYLVELSSGNFKNSGYKSEESLSMYSPNARELLIGAVNELRLEVEMLTPTAELVYNILKDDASFPVETFRICAPMSEYVAKPKEDIITLIQRYIGTYAPIKVACIKLCDSIGQIVSLPGDQFGSAISFAPKYAHLDTTGTPGMFSMVIPLSTMQPKWKTLRIDRSSMTTFRNFNSTRTFPTSFKAINPKWAYVDKYITGAGLDLEAFVRLYMTLFVHIYNMNLGLHPLSYLEADDVDFLNYFLRDGTTFPENVVFATKTIPALVSSILSRQRNITQAQLLDFNGFSLSNRYGFFPISKNTFYRSLSAPILSMGELLFKQLIKLVEQYTAAGSELAANMATNIIELVNLPSTRISDRAMVMYRLGYTFSGLGIYTRTIANLVSITGTGNAGNAPYTITFYRDAGEGIKVVVGNTMKKRIANHTISERLGILVSHIRNFAPFEMVYNLDVMAATCTNILIQLYNLESQINGKDPAGNIQTAFTSKICNLIAAQE